MDEKNIAWDMHYGLPNQTYLEFIARYILQRKKDQPLVDPFALDVPAADIVQNVYVEREKVENEINRPGTRIIIGPEGSGKTTLFRKQSTFKNPSAFSQHGRTLLVQLPLTQTDTLLPEQDLLEGKISPLAAKPLARRIFHAYFKDITGSSNARGMFISQLRHNQQWMARFQWFYQRYTPLQLEIIDDFELVAWLHDVSSHKIFGPPTTSQPVLRELVDFVTFFPQGDHIQQPYTNIQILVDGTEYLSSQAINRLLQDMQELDALQLDKLSFKLLAHSALQNQLEDYARRGRVPIYRLPRWDKKDLRQILDQRLEYWGNGVYIGYDWGRYIPPKHLVARSEFVNAIVCGAARVYQEKKSKMTDCDAPIHALRLARGLVAACAGCWKELGVEPPLRYDQIKAIVDIYWEKGEE